MSEHVLQYSESNTVVFRVAEQVAIRGNTNTKVPVSTTQRALHYFMPNPNVLKSQLMMPPFGIPGTGPCKAFGVLIENV